MKLSASREQILAPLQSVIGVVERRQTMPVLSNVLLAARNNRISITGTDLEVELVASGEAQVQQPGDVTVPGRKLLDIFRALPEKTSVTVATDGERLSIKAGRSRFTLSTLPAAEFPVVEEINAQQTLTLGQGDFRRLIDKTHFSMAQQDVRYYLNGLLLETDGKTLRAVATDGHRLALCETELETKAKNNQQVILPRKGVLELQRILGGDGSVDLAIGTSHVRAQIGDIRFTFFPAGPVPGPGPRPCRPGARPTGTAPVRCAVRTWHTPARRPAPAAASRGGARTHRGCRATPRRCPTECRRPSGSPRSGRL